METHEPRGGDLEVNGVRLHYLDWGGDGDPIVVLHATGFIGRIYRPIALAPCHRTISERISLPSV